MADTLDTLVAKAEALEAMRLRGDAGYPEALALFTRERDAWVKRMQNELLGLCLQPFNDALKGPRKL